VLCSKLGLERVFFSAICSIEEKDRWRWSEVRVDKGSLMKYLAKEKKIKNQAAIPSAIRK